MRDLLSVSIGVEVGFLGIVSATIMVAESTFFGNAAK